MYLKKFLFYLLSFNISYFSKNNINNLNNYLHILYPSLKNFYLKSENFLPNIENKNSEIKGIFFHISNNIELIQLLKYSDKEKILKYLKNILIIIENYKIKIFFEEKHEESIFITNIIFNKNKNHWFEYIKKHYKYIENYKISSFELISINSYELKLTEKEINFLYNNLKENAELLFLFYLLENINSILEKEVCVFDPFTKKKISYEVFKKIIEKQIYMYICNMLYKEY
jgi:hypothetical protein